MNEKSGRRRELWNYRKKKSFYEEESSFKKRFTFSICRSMNICK